MLTALALLFATIASAGDTLSVKGGDTLHGQLVDIREGIVTFKADLAGKVLVPVDEVVAINVELPVELTLTGSAPVRGFLSTKESTILFQTGDEPAKPIHLAEVALLRPVREETRTGRSPTEISLSGGAMYLSGTRDLTVPYLKIDIQRDYYADRGSRLSADIADSAEGNFPDYGRVQLDWNLASGAAIRPVVMANIERNVSQGLAIGGEIGVFGEHTLVDTDEHQASVGLGLQADWESVDRELLDREDSRAYFDELFYHSQDSRRSRTSLDAALLLQHSGILFGSGTLRNQLLVAPSLSELGEFRMRGETQWLRPLNEQLDLELRLRIDYSSDPEFTEIDRWNGSVGAGLRWNYSRGR